MSTIDKFVIIQRALRQMGENVPTSPDDASTEWDTCSDAFDRAIDLIGAEHNWNFSNGSELLENEADDNPSPNYAIAYVKPVDCLHVQSLWTSDGEPFTDYEIVGNRICVDSTEALTLKFVRMPEPEDCPPHVIEALTLYVEAGIAGGLQTDFGLQRTKTAMADNMLQRARTRSDQQQPGRYLRRSSLLQARLRRRGTRAYSVEE